nr:bifunctional hydroxymethylpyrimidine kinase/phosphomethylpyrimidine kinase [uncultured Sphingosinicella sp.]
MSVPRILIIAGSDSGGGAGIQADIKTVTMMGGHAMTAITAITAQNTLGVDAVMAVPAGMVLKQIDAVVSDIGVDAVKIGMIGSAEVAEAVAERLEGLDVPIVFDPVMVASSGAVLADARTIRVFDRLLKLAALATPNTPELAALAGMEVRDEAERDRAVEEVMDRTGCRALLAKGGHLPHSESDEISDVLYDSEYNERHWSGLRIDTVHNHGTGCTLASAIAVGLGRGERLADAVDIARDFVRTAMKAAPGLGGGHGPMGHWAARGGAMNLNQVTVGALNYGDSIRFYRALGLRQIVDAPPRYARFEAPGGATFSIHVEETPSTRSDTLIYFEVAELDALAERLSTDGIGFLSMPEDKPWLWREARLLDPAGNRICLYRAGENRRFPPWRIAG